MRCFRINRRYTVINKSYKFIQIIDGAYRWKFQGGSLKSFKLRECSEAPVEDDECFLFREGYKFARSLGNLPVNLNVDEWFCTRLVQSGEMFQLRGVYHCNPPYYMRHFRLVYKVYIAGTTERTSKRKTRARYPLTGWNVMSTQNGSSLLSCR